MDKKLVDKLFREKLNAPDIPFDEEHWLAMEKRLDAQKAKRRTIFWIGLSGAAALIIFLSLFSLWTVQRAHWAIPALVQKETNPQKTGDKPADSVNSQAGQDSETGQDSEHTAMLVDTTKSGRKQQASWQHQPTTVNSIVGDVTRKFIAVRATTIDTLASNSNSWQLKNQRLIAANQFIGPHQLPMQPTTSEPSRQNKNPGYLTILAAPDLTGVQGAGTQELGANFGVLYNLPLGHKLSISAGVLYAKKNYNMPYSKYGRPLARGRYAPTDQVYAACDVLEVPLLVNYEVFHRNNTRINLGTGLSSYFMLQEQYGFSRGSASDVFWSYEVSGKNNHLLGVANVSVLIEQQVSKRFSIGVNPFVKLPLTGIGDGRVKLQSQGVAISVNFRLGSQDR